jgi:hypothetical protein
VVLAFRLAGILGIVPFLSSCGLAHRPQGSESFFSAWLAVLVLPRLEGYGEAGEW